MKDMQTFLKDFQHEMGWEISNSNYQESRASLLNNYMLLTTELSEVAEEFRAIFNETKKLVNETNLSEDEAYSLAKEKQIDHIGHELSDCMAYLIKFANYFEINLEESFYSKMDIIEKRENKDK